MSELIYVMNLTNFQEFSTGSRKAVDNPAALWALSTIGAGNKSRPSRLNYLIFTYN